jgi:hypothetical protein
MANLEAISRRRFVKAAILSSATLALVPELADAASHGPACVNGGEPCHQCVILGVAVTARRYPQRVINPWQNWKVL